MMTAQSDGGRGFREYCKLNSCTEEGLQSIAKYNSFTDAWVKETKLFDNNTSMEQKRFISFKLYAKFRNKRDHHIDIMEGGHRKVGIIQANFCSPLDPERGCFSKPTSYTVAQFRQGGMMPAEGILNSDIIGAYNKVIKEGSNSSGFFYATAMVTVRYVKNPDISVPKFLETCTQTVVNTS